MTLICHGCSTDIYNPFYVTSALVIDRSKKRAAISDTEVSVCLRETKKIEEYFHDSIEDLKGDIAFIVQSARGTEGGISGAVQIVWGYEKDRNCRYVDREIFEKYLPKTAMYLVSSNDWGEFPFDGKHFLSTEWPKESPVLKALLRGYKERR